MLLSVEEGGGRGRGGSWVGWVEGREGWKATHDMTFTATAVQSEEGGVGGASRLGMIDAGARGKGREDLRRLSDGVLQASRVVVVRVVVRIG